MHISATFCPTIRVRNLIHFFLLACVLPGLPTSLQAQEKNSEILAAQVYVHANGRTWDGGIYIGAGLRFRNHELSFQYSPVRAYSRYGGLHYRYYFPDAGRPIRPFVGLEGMIGSSRRIIAGWNVDQFTAQTRGLQLILGGDVVLWRGLRLYSYFGAGRVWGTTFFSRPERLIANELSFALGLKYDVVLKDERNQELSLPHKEVPPQRFFVSYRYRITTISFINLPVDAGELGSHQLFGEYAFLPWLRVIGGVQLGNLQREDMPQPQFGYQGFLIGMKARLYQWKRLGFFHDFGYVHGLRPRFEYYQRHTYFAGSLEYRLAPRIHLTGGMMFMLGGNDTRHAVQGGVSFGLSKLPLRTED